MIPRYKVFEQSIALIAVYVAVRLMELPTIRRHFVAGIFVGLAAFFGRNHGLYNLIAFGIVILVLGSANWSKLSRRLLSWIGGICCGYLPQLVMFVFVPGYFRSFSRAASVRPPCWHEPICRSAVALASRIS
jgi:hypothetical protein